MNTRQIPIFLQDIHNHMCVQRYTLRMFLNTWFDANYQSIFTIHHPNDITSRWKMLVEYKFLFFCMKCFPKYDDVGLELHINT